jgi:FkbM family methyltransferase
MIKRRTHRRSGNAVVEVAWGLDWEPDMIVQVGVGSVCHEVEVFREEWPDVILIGFDPNPDSFDVMKRKFPGLLVPMAVGACQAESVAFYSKKNHDNGSSLLRVGENKSKLIQRTVSMTSLDESEDLLKFGRGRKTLLWIDCEGTELDVLRGGNDFLRQVWMVNVEMTGIPSANGWCSPERVDQFLRDAGFYLTWIHTIRTGHGQYDAVYVKGNIFNPRICCCPSEIERWENVGPEETI